MRCERTRDWRQRTGFPKPPLVSCHGLVQHQFVEGWEPVALMWPWSLRVRCRRLSYRQPCEPATG